MMCSQLSAWVDILVDCNMDMIEAILEGRRAIASRFNYSDRSHP
ncbi:hypothetical protein [Kamptonema sp. UHCC 0994]|nr:hypothetical protein [Kamptonema sp. UHCC 0994]MDF0554871.1 hypothetical protein [Kamptonema sp. UHCC 0994]